MIALFLISLISLSLPACAMEAPAVEQSFAQWRQELRVQAMEEYNISESTLQATLDKAEILPKIYELLEKQPEFTLTYAQYLERVLPDARIATARERFAEHQELLTRVSQDYGVAPQYIVALWGVETDFGRRTGDYSIVNALFTLSYNTRRAAFFRKQLLQALQIVEAGHIDAEGLKGSWAGAMGQNQFMPSSFLNYAVDYDGDGRKDIWNNLPDIFASIANYLKTERWTTGQPWGLAIAVPEGFPSDQASRDNKKPVEEWARLGATQVNGAPLPSVPGRAAIVLPQDGETSPAFLTYNNFDTIMHWNRSLYFATTVGQLADKIAE